MEMPRALLSDADGTLIDTVGLIRHGQYEAAKTYLEQQGIPDAELPTYETYETHLNQSVGGSTRDTLERTVRLLYAQQPHHLESLDYDALHDLLQPVQDRIAPEFIKPYDGLPRFLSQLGRDGIKLAIITSGSPYMVVRNFGIALPELGLTDLYQNTESTDRQKLAQFESTVAEHFDIPGFTVVTCDDVTEHKPHPEGFQLAMQRLGVTPEETAVLGDHKYDMEIGVRAGAPTRIGITHGFDDRAALEAANATLIVDSLNELSDLLQK